MSNHAKNGSAIPVLQVNQLKVALPSGADRSHAVHDVSFCVDAGKTVCLVGESGSGKSVIANTVMGLLPQQLTVESGSIELLGQTISNKPQAVLRRLRGPAMGMVFQEPMTALNPTMRCGQQLDEMLKRHTSMSARKRRQRILEMFEHVRLPDPARIFVAYPHQLSGGQRQRIVIAIALILKPALLICDEPTTALDVTTQAEILRLIVALQKENNTAVLFITHDFGVVAEIADDVVVLEHGKLIEAGDKEHVLKKPSQPYTKMLLSAVPSLITQPRESISESSPLIEAKEISKTYINGSWPFNRQQVRAVVDISLQIRPRETVGVVGESGSGKSTFARCLAHLIEPTKGEILINNSALKGASRKQLSAFRRQVQIVFQDPYRSLNPRQTVGASIIEGPINFGVSRAEALERARSLMELVHLSPSALTRYPSEFSGGQRQRISIARALACEPRVLIADEAVSALDVSVQAQILKLLDEIQQRFNLGILFITHDLRVASQICDRVLVMHQGRVVESGLTHAVFSSPKADYTAKLLASAPGRGYTFGVGHDVAFG